MGAEMIDVYDENLQRLATVSRDEAHARGMWHRSIHCWIVRPSGEGYVLFQKRGRNKKVFPNRLDITAAGHYEAGETPADGVREILEELGLDVRFSDLRPLGIKVDLAKLSDQLINREFCDVYFLQRSEVPGEYELDPSEVEGLVEIRISDGLKLFSGESNYAEARGVEWIEEERRWSPLRLQLTLSDFIPRIDPYYLKIFIMARALLRGEQYLSI